MKKRSMAFTLVLMLLLGMLAGCAGPAQEEGPAAATTVPASAATTAASAGETTTPAETVTLDVVMFQWWEDANEIWTSYAADSMVLAAIEAELGIRLNVVGADKEQQQVYFVSGDMGDIAMINSVVDVQTLSESELLVPLNDLADQYGPNVKGLSQVAWSTAVNVLGDGVNAYALPIQVGNEGAAMQNGRYIYTLRYNHWEELGFPEWTNYYEYLDDIAKLAALHPTTDEGLPTIGISVQNESTVSTASFENRMYGTYGFGEAGGNGALKISIADGAFVNNYMDEISPFWLCVDFYRYANKLGILDPDWAVQSSTELTEKHDAGRIISADVYTSGRTTYIADKLEKDPAYLGGWINVPVDGNMIYQNAQQLAGWEICFWAIPSSSKNPEAAMKWLNYTYSPEGGRVITNGVQGVHWEYDGNGAPVLTQAFYDLPTDKGERRVLSLLGMFRGTSNATICPDGSPMNLRYSPEYYALTATEPWLVAYDEHYNISWPNEMFLERVEKGDMFDRARYDQRVAAMMSPYSEDMQRIEALCVSTAYSYMARLVHASDAELQGLRAEMTAELEGYGIDKLYEYGKARYEEIYNELGLKEYLASFPPVKGR